MSFTPHGGTQHTQIRFHASASQSLEYIDCKTFIGSEFNMLYTIFTAERGFDLVVICYL